MGIIFRLYFCFKTDCKSTINFWNHQIFVFLQVDKVGIYGLRGAGDEMDLCRARYIRFYGVGAP